VLKKIIFVFIALTVLAYVMYSCATSSNQVGLPPAGTDVSSEDGEDDAAAGSEAAAVPPPSIDGIVDDGIVGIMPEGEGDDEAADTAADVESAAGSDTASAANAGDASAADDKAASGKEKSDKKTVMPSFASLKSESGWYLSNGSGMILEKTSQTRALRNAYAIQILNVKPENVPKEIVKYYSATWKIECRILYHEGRRTRTQWVYKDAGMSTLFIASIGEDGSGFLEWYDDKAYVVEEQRLAADGSGLFISYTYSGQYLLKAEAVVVAPVVKPEPQKTDDEAAATTEVAAADSTVADGASASGTASETASETAAAQDGAGTDADVGVAAGADANAAVPGAPAAEAVVAAVPETTPPQRRLPQRLRPRPQARRHEGRRIL
jgi:hypothetical protein